MIKQLLLNSVIAKYRDLSVSRRSIICLSLWLRQIIDLLATDKSRYFAQPRPIIGNYSATDGATLKAVIFFCVHNFLKKIITLRVKKSNPPLPSQTNLEFQFVLCSGQTTTRILQFVVFLCKLRLLLFKPLQD